jgi:hypothetical protein
MGRRIILGVSLIAALAFAAMAATATPAARPAQASVGREVPAFLAAEPGRATIVWAFREDDLLSCTNDAMSIRHATLRFPSSVRLVVVPVGDDTGLLASFMRRERLRGEVRRLPGTSLAAALGETDVPAVFVITGRHIREASSDSTWSNGVSRGTRPLEAVLAALLDRNSRP